ncbi:MAG: ArnT family glycosyltransferase [Planctomycetota bacterium]
MTSGSGIPRAFLALLIVQACFLYTLIATGDVPFGEDQDAYLAAAHEARKGGPLFDGQRHPLLPLVLAALSPSGEAGFTASRLIVSAGLVLMTLGQFLWARGLWGSGPAFLWAWFLGFNHLVLSMGAMVMVEPWLIQLLGFTVLAMVQAQRLQRRWWVAGVMLGLAYLAKGTVPVVAVAIFAGLALVRQWRATVSVALGFLPWVGLFCLYRLSAFGDPWHQVSQGISWLGHYHPHQLVGSGFGQELERVGWEGFAARLWSGAGELPPLLPSVLSPLRGGWSTFSLMVVMLCGLPMMRLTLQSGWGSLCSAKGRRVLLMMATLWALGVVLFCAWMVPVAKVPRYGAPLIPLAALAVVHLWRRSKPHTLKPELPWRRSWLWVAMTAFLLPWPHLSWANLVNPDASWRKDPRYRAYQTIRETIEAESPAIRPRVLYGPGQFLPREWLWDYERVWLPFDAQHDPIAVSQAFESSDFWVIDRGTRERNGSLFQEACRGLGQRGRLLYSGDTGLDPVQVFQRNEGFQKTP